MANKPAERNTQAKRNQSIQPGRMNIYVDGKFRAQLNDDAAQTYAEHEMSKGGSVFVTRQQFDVSGYMA